MSRKVVELECDCVSTVQIVAGGTSSRRMRGVVGSGVVWVRSVSDLKRRVRMGGVTD